MLKPKYLLLTCLAAAGLLARSARADISATADPATQQAIAGGTFNVDLSLTITGTMGDPDTVAGFDIYLATDVANSGYFSITSATATGTINGAGPTNPTGDPISNTATNTNFVVNGIDQGFNGGGSISPPLANSPLETLTLSIAPGTPMGTYTLMTTTSDQDTGLFSDVGDNAGNVFEITTPGTFQITVVPEPATVSMIAFGALGCLGLQVLRRRRNLA